MGLLLKASKPPNAHLILDTQEATFFEARVRSGGEPAQENPLQQKNVCQMGDMGDRRYLCQLFAAPYYCRGFVDQASRYHASSQTPLCPPLSLAI